MTVFDIASAGVLAAEARRAKDPGVGPLLWYAELDDGRCVTIYQFIFNARVCIGPIGASTYDDGYCYGHAAQAVVRAAQWVTAGAAGEPDGWMKNLQTGEFREP